VNVNCADLILILLAVAIVLSIVYLFFLLYEYARYEAMQRHHDKRIER
jgi:hypothetical protein